MAQNLPKLRRLPWITVSGALSVGSMADAIVTDLELEPPVDPDVIASFLGITRITTEFMRPSGCLVCDGSEVVIRVRATDAAERQRFTILHECAHTWFEGFRLRPQYRCNPQSRPATTVDLEALCDRAASAMLLPTEPLRADIRAHGVSIGAITHLASRYQASLEATANRVVTIADDPVLFVVLEERTKPSERSNPHAPPRLRVRYARGNGRWPYVAPHKSVSNGNPLHRAFEGEIIDEIAELDEIVRTPVDNLKVSARLVPYGETMRVLATFSQEPDTPRHRMDDE